MKLPIHCPCCKSPLLTEYDFVHGHEIIRKSCLKRVDHKFSAAADTTDPDEVTALGVEIDSVDLIRITWNFVDQQCFVTKGNSSKLTDDDVFELPWFIPDLTDYKKLFKKLRTYVVFS